MTSTPFHDLDQYVGIPRLSGLVLNADGTRLVTSVATLDAKKTKFVTALWEVDPTGEKPARRLTRSAKGESSAAFTSNGDLLFTSARPDPDGKDGGDDEPVPALWLLPRDGAEARVVADRAAGLGGVHVAKDADVVLVGSDVLPSASDAEADEKLRKTRKEKKVAAILHDGYPVRFWDHDLGPESPHLFVAEVGTDVVAPLADSQGPAADPQGRHARGALGAGGAGVGDQPGRSHGGHRLEPAVGQGRAAGAAGGDRRGVGGAPGARGRPRRRPLVAGHLAGRAVGRVRARVAVDAARGAARHPPDRPAGRRRRAHARRELGPLAVEPRSGCRTARACS